MTTSVTRLPVSDSRSVALLAGDLVVLTLFAVVGRRTHDEEVALAAAFDVARTAAPFLLGWVVAAVATRALHRETAVTLRSMLLHTLIAWAVALPLAVVVRAVLLGRFSPWSFYLVASVVPLLMLLCWRLAFWVVTRSAGRDARG